MHGRCIKIKNSLTTFCRPIIICMLNCSTESKHVTEGRKYLPRGPHIGQPWNNQTKPTRLEKYFGKGTISTLGTPTPIERIRQYRRPEWEDDDRLWICRNRPYWPNTTTKLEFCLQGAEPACHFVLDRYFKRTDTQHLFVLSAAGQILMGILCLTLNLMRDCRLHLHEYHTSAVIINYVTVGFSVVVSTLNLLISAFDPGLGRILDSAAVFNTA